LDYLYRVENPYQLKTNRHEKISFAILACLFCSLVLISSTRSQVPDWTQVLQMNTYGLPYVNAVTADAEYVYMAVRFSGPGTFGGVVGTSVGFNDLLIVKISNAGAVQWVKLYNAGAGGTITPDAIKVDGSGNIFLAASFSGTVTIGGNTFSSDVTRNSFYAGFSSSGDGVWATPFLNTGYYSSKIALDASGNSFLISKSNKLLKFSNSGALLWEQTYPHRTLLGLAVYGSNYYLVGALQSGTTNFGTIALASLGGYNTGFLVKADLDGVYTNSLVAGGSTTGDGSSVSDIVTDGNGNLLITGCFTTGLILGDITIGPLPKTYYTYIAKCNQNFAFTYAHPSSDFLNPTRNMYNFRIFTDNAGNIWEFGMIDDSFTYNGVPVTLDAGDQFLVKFDAYGWPQSAYALQHAYVGRTHLDQSGKLTIGGAYDYEGAAAYGNYYVTHYNNNIVQEWQQVSTNSMAGTAQIRYIKYDAGGNTYLQSRIIGHCDYFGTPINTSVYITVISKHDINGNLIWKQQIADISPELFGPAFILDKDNNVLTIGLFGQSIEIGGTTLTNSNGGNDGYVAMFGSDGSFKMAAKFNLSQQIGTYMTVAADQTGKVIVSGQIEVANYLIKFDPLGNQLWSKSFPMESYYSSMIATDAGNNIYMTSEIYPLGTIQIGNVTLTQTNEDGATVLIKFDPDGNALWAKTYGGVAGASYPGGWSCDINTDASGNSYLWGWCPNDANFGGTILVNPFAVNQGYSYFLTKINTSGDVVWAKAVYETKYAFNYGDMLDLDQEGNVYVGGDFVDRISIDGNEFVPEGTCDNFTVKFSDAGTFQWIKTIPSSNPMIIRALSVYDDNILSVAGAPGMNNTLGGVPIIRKGGSDCMVATMVLVDPIPNAVNIGGTDGSTAEFNIFTNRSWTAVSDQTWLTVNPAAGTGNASVTFSAAANPTTAQRTAIVTITYTGVPQTVQTLTIVQAGGSFGIDDLEGRKCLVYPNPAENTLFLVTAVEQGIVSITAADGKVVYQGQISGDRIAIGALRPGIYTIRISDRKGTVISKFAKQ